MMNWKDLTSGLEGENVTRDPGAEIVRLSIDSRSLTQFDETLFFAVHGDQQNGHDFMRQLYRKGVRNFVAEEEVDSDEFSEANLLITRSSVQALQVIASQKRMAHDLQVIGVTGSNGKTTVKEWLNIVLGRKYSVVKNPGSYNSQIGVPLSVWNITKNHDVGIFEAGISRQAEMQKLEKILCPNWGVFTCIGPAHSAGFQSREEKIHEKAILFKNSRKIILSADHEEIFGVLSELYPSNCVTWSLKGKAADYSFTRDGRDIVLQKGSEQISFELPFELDIWVENALHVITVSLEFGLAADMIRQGLKQLLPVKMRLEIKKGIKGTYILDDTYNNDLQSLEAALQFLEKQQQKQKRTLILSDLLDTGNQHDIPQHVQKLVRKHRVDRLVTVGNQLAALGGSDDLSVEAFRTTDHLLEKLPSFDEEMILVKGARAFQLERVVHRLQEKSHRTRLEINFESLVYNLRMYRQKLSPGVKIMGMVKAFAYGGGNLEIANLLQYHKVDYLGVAFSDEAIALRQNGISIPIMVMNPEEESLQKLKEHDVEAEVYNVKGLHALTDLRGSVPAVHLKIETGMHRLGFARHEWNDLGDFLKNRPEIKVNGIFTHFSSAEDPGADTFTEEQAQIFDEAYILLSGYLGYTPLRHVVNSAGIVRWPHYHYDMVRLGLGLHGVDITENLALRTVSRWVTVISQIKYLEKGAYIGYNRSGQAQKKMTIATLPVGYADGYSRMFGNGRGNVMIHDKAAPTVGNICMDMTMVDITGIECREGDEVILMSDRPSIHDLARWSSTIPYEILTGISQRVKRIYLSE